MSNEVSGDQPVSSRSTVTVPEHVVHRDFAQETVILNLETGQYHGLNPVGGRMLTVLQTGSSVGEVAARLAEEFDQPVEDVERDLVAFCSDLAARGLIEIQHEPSG
jgi:hypothetical protein